MNILKFNKSLKNNFKHFSSILNPNTLMYSHKKELQKIQKIKTRMKTPEILEKLNLTEEIDFEPGIAYLGNGEQELEIKVCPKKNTKPFAESTPEDGFIQITMPFDADTKLRRSYKLLHFDRLRYGKILEIMDYISVTSACRFNNIIPRNKMATLVTAGVDTIELFREFELNKRLVVNAYPTWTGESSLEIRLDLYQGGDCESGKDNFTVSDDHFLGCANFVYVMREAENYNMKKKVSKLNLNNFTEKEEKEKALLRQEIGAENKKMTIKKSQKSLFLSPPTPEECAILHEQFVTYKKNKDLFLLQNVKGLDGIQCNSTNNSITREYTKTIADTKIEKCVLMHSQNMNSNGHVFGGYIMRESLELGHVCAYLHSNKESPTLMSIDTVTFHKPVIVGSVAQFIAHVCLVQDELLNVGVEVYNYVDTQVCPILTTTINITYRTKSKTPRVVPSTYECGVKFLEAKRIVERIFDVI